MILISRQTFGKAFIAMALSTGLSVLIAGTIVPILGGTYDGIGMWMSFLCPMVISFPASAWQFHQSETLRKACDELVSLHHQLDRMHSELTLAHGALKEKSRHDAMTGGLNRETFMAELEATSKQGRAGSLLLVDADNFKRINDTFGHQTGDEALVAIGSAIATTLGVRDYWGRIGGEEFGIFLDRASEREAFAVAETIRGKVEATHIRRERGMVPVTISVGGVTVGRGFSLTQSLSDADSRLYRAKRSGRNRVMFDDVDNDDDVSAA